MNNIHGDSGHAVRFYCGLCPYNTEEDKAFILHYDKEHRTVYQYYWCRKCGSCVTSVASLIAHTRDNCMEVKSFTFRCSFGQCKFSNDDVYKFIDHLKASHRGIHLLPCIECNKLFTIPSILAHHMQMECMKRKASEEHSPSTTKTDETGETTKENSKKPLKKFSALRKTSKNSPSKVANTPLDKSKHSTKIICPVKVVKKSKRDGRKSKRPSLKMKPVSDEEWKPKSLRLCNDQDSDPDDPTWEPGSSRLILRSDSPVSSREPFNTGYSEENEALTSFGTGNRKIKKSEKDRKGAKKGRIVKAANAIANVKRHLKDKPEKTSVDKGGRKSPVVEKEVANEVKLKNSQRKKKRRKKMIEPDEVPTHEESMPSGKKRAIESLELSTPGIEERIGETGDEERVIEKTVVSTTSKGGIKVAVETASGKKPYYKEWSDWWKSIKHRKSLRALVQLQKCESYLCEFFKCMEYYCHFSTNDDKEFVKHQVEEHRCKKSACLYCLVEYEAGVSLVEHIVSTHGMRNQQCSLCVYRAATRAHVRVHIEDVHQGNYATYECARFGQDTKDVEAEVEVVLPYLCQLCKYKTFIPEEFIRHNEELHSGVSVYLCSYCEAKQHSLDELMRHFCLHGMYNYHCPYCISGSNVVREVLLHECLNHAEKPLEVYCRSQSELPPSCKNTDRPSSNSTGKLTEIETCGKKIPAFHSNYSRNFSCGVEKCHQVLAKVETYKCHLVVSHHCNTVFPCPHCTNISHTLSSLEEHMSMHGPNLYSCSVEGCNLLHWEKGVVVAHSSDEHPDNSGIVVTVRELTGKVETQNDLECATKVKLESSTPCQDNEETSFHRPHPSRKFHSVRPCPASKKPRYCPPCPASKKSNFYI